MSEEKSCSCNCKQSKIKIHSGFGGLYGFGVIASLFYFLSHVTSAESFLVALFKSLFWPSLFIFKALELWKF